MRDGSTLYIDASPRSFRPRGSESGKHTIELFTVQELYSLVGRWAREVVIHHVTYQRVMNGELGYNEALDITINNKASVDASRMFTLAELYFPSAHAALQQLKLLWDEASSIQRDFKEMHKNSDATSRQHANQLTSVLERFNLAVDEYQKTLAAHAANV